jgi:uncharacterized membrane protein YphA (DoxX/SURF4 family)
MERSPGFYAAVAVILLVVIGLLVGLGLTGKWIAFLTIAILFILIAVFLTEMSTQHKS